MASAGEEHRKIALKLSRSLPEYANLEGGIHDCLEDHFLFLGAILRVFEERIPAAFQQVRILVYFPFAQVVQGSIQKLNQMKAIMNQEGFREQVSVEPNIGPAPDPWSWSQSCLAPLWEKRRSTSALALFSSLPSVRSSTCPRSPSLTTVAYLFHPFPKDLSSMHR